MNKQILLAQLEQYDLDQAEANVYLFLLENGPQTPLELSRAINVDRSKIYRSIERLAGKGFIEQSHAAWGKKLRAASPDNLARLIKEAEEGLLSKKQALPSLLDSLNSVSTIVKREFEVRHYHGQDGLRQMLWNHLVAKKDIVAFSYSNKNDITGKTFADKIRAEQVERKIMLYEVENETDQGDLWYTSVKEWGKFYDSRHIMPEVLDIKQYTAIYNDTVSIINWVDDEQVGLEIINAPYAEMQRQLFWKFWEIADPKNSKVTSNLIKK